MLVSFFEQFNTSFTLLVIFPFVIGLGLYLSFKLRFLQISKLKLSFVKLTKKESGAEGSITHYQAISAVLAGNLGTGNISGMAVALATGGPGALFWMWVMAFLGSIIQFASCVLGVKYRTKNEKGEYVGGPMYYLANGLKLKSLGVLFALLTIIAALAVGNFVQINSIALPLKALGIPPAVCGIVMAISVAVVMLGGVRRMAVVASSIVPVMAVLYLGTALVILALNITEVLPAISLMVRSAFGGMSLLGGAAGYGVMRSITTGFDRGIFATDAGTGIVPILQAGAKTKHPVIDGIVTLIAPFLVMIVCTATGLVLIITGAWQNPDLQSTSVVTHAFALGIGSTIGFAIVLIALVLFAYTTILAWGTCAEKAVGFVFGTSRVRLFQYFYILLIPFGAFMRVEFVWMLADVAITSMLFINLIGIAGLSKEVIGESKDFFFPKLETSVE